MPEIFSIKTVNGRHITTERYLAGTPLSKSLKEQATKAEPAQAITAILEVLRTLAAIKPTPEHRMLAVLDEVHPLADPDDTWSRTIEKLIERRLATFGRQLAKDIPNLEQLTESLYLFLKTRDHVPQALIHGDLCGGNILVDDQLKPTAVLDFGFLSTVGDPAFDVSISTAIFNMYGG